MLTGGAFNRHFDVSIRSISTAPATGRTDSFVRSFVGLSGPVRPRTLDLANRRFKVFNMSAQPQRTRVTVGGVQFDLEPRYQPPFTPLGAGALSSASLDRPDSLCVYIYVSFIFLQIWDCGVESTCSQLLYMLSSTSDSI